MAPGRSIKAVLSGTANPVVTADQLDVRLSYEGFEAIGSGMGAAGFWVLDDTTSMLEVAQVVSRFLAVESCGQCPACKLGCLAVTDGLDRLVTGDAVPEEVETLASGCAPSPTATVATCRCRSSGSSAASSPRSPTR